MRLKFVNAAEDVPRRIEAAGKACEGGEVLLILLPQERICLYALGKSADFPVFLHTSEGGPDFPKVGASVPLKRAIEAVARVRARPLGGLGQVVMRGQWSGTAECTEEGALRVEMRRKVASYGVLVITCDGEGHGWNWEVQRLERFHGGAKASQGNAPALVEAIQQGYAAAVELIAESCAVRDTQRRQALDPVYAEQRPIRPAAEGKTDPVAASLKRLAKETSAQRARARVAPARKATSAAGATPRTQAEKDQALLSQIQTLLPGIVQQVKGAA